MRRVRNRDTRCSPHTSARQRTRVPTVISSRDERFAQQGNRCRSGASATTRKSNVAHELAARPETRRGAQDVGVSRFLGLSAGASPSRALHTRRLVAQAVVSVTEACSRSIVIHSGVFSAETGAAIALRLHCTTTRCCDVHAQVPWAIGTCLQHLRLSLVCAVHGIPAPCASSPELILHSICASPSPPNFKTLPCRSLGHNFPSFLFSLRESLIH